MVALPFNARTVEPKTGFTAIPAGFYNVMISADPEWKPTKKGDGNMLLITPKVVDGPHKGVSIFMRLNLQNPNQQAVDIAYRELSAICHAVGVLDLQDTSQLMNIPFIAKVKLRKGNINLETGEKYEDSDGISDYFSANNTSALAQLAAQNAGTTSAPAAGIPAPPVAGPKPAPTFTPPPMAAVPAAPAAVAPPAPVAAPAAPPAPIADEYQYSPDKRFRWKTGMAGWEPVPAAAPPAPPMPAGVPAQPWTQPMDPAAPAAGAAAPTPAAPPAPPAPAAVTSAQAPWMPPQ